MTRTFFMLAGLVVLATANARSQSVGHRAATTEEFAKELRAVLPAENSYAYHKRLTETPVHVPARATNARRGTGELAISNQGWKLIYDRRSSAILRNAVEDFQDYLLRSMKVNVTVEALDALDAWQSLSRSIVVGTRDQIPGCGGELTGAKGYEIAVSAEQLVVCGYDDRGAMFGLFNVEARMNLREAPFLPSNLRAVRNSLHDTRMVHSWMGWMDFPDTMLAHMAHNGFDSVFASVYTNPNGDRTTAENSLDFYARLLFRVRNQDPARIHDLIKRAKRFGIKVYTPVIYQYTGTEASEAGLRKLVRDILQEFPDIQGYVLLTEGFWYKKWGGLHGAPKEHVEDWARNWAKAVGIVAQECHRVNPAIEILPWEYNIDFRPENADTKRYFIQQLPADTIPMLTWENGKGFEIDGMQGFLRDYSLSQVGPAEVTHAQIAEARARGMKVYSKVDTFASWQFGTVPYLPCPYQWYRRYNALEKYKVNGTLESWSSGFGPHFIAELRAWSAWSDPPPLDDLLGAIAARDFGAANRDAVVAAWRHFSQAISTVPDTGPNMGTNNAVGNPLFFQEPPVRTVTFHHSWTDHAKWMGYFGGGINPYWPFTVSRMVFYPDFTNKVNKAEQYARSATGIQVGDNVPLLPVFLKYLKKSADEMEKGLKLYRAAALASIRSKRQKAFREVVIAEQLHRMMESNRAILEFEDLRLKQSSAQNFSTAPATLARMERIVREEISRTERSLLAATRDSRLGFQYEQDYVYTPYSLKEKLVLLRDTLQNQLPAARKNRVAFAAPRPPGNRRSERSPE